MRFRPSLFTFALLTSALAACDGGNPVTDVDAAATPEPDPDAAAPDAGAPDAMTPDAMTADATTPGTDADLTIPAPAIVAFSTPSIDHYPDDITGFRFTVGGTDLTVTELGFFDDDGDGLGEAHPVGIYEVASQLQIASVTVPAATAAPLDGAFRYVPVAAPTTLSANTSYVVLAYRPTAVDGVAYFVGNLKVSPLVTYDSEVAANDAGELIFTNTPFGYPNSWFGPNFKVSR